MLLMLHASLLVFLIGAASGGQDVAVHDEAVSRLLDQAARYQRGEDARPLPASLYGRFFATVQGEDGRISLDLERWYTREPERMLTHRVVEVAESRQTLGFDGERAWFRDDKSGSVTVYSDDEETYDVDIEQMEEQRRMTRLLLESFVLDALIPRLLDIRLGDEDTFKDLDGFVHPVRHVVARMADDVFPAPLDAPPPAPDDPPRLLELDFAVDTDTGALWTLTVTPLGRDDLAALEMRFAFHGRTRSGLSVPGNVKVFRVGERDEMINLGVEMDDEGLLVLEVDGEIDEARFEVPADD